MTYMDLIAMLATIGFVGVLVGCSVAGSRVFGLEQRARLLERRDPGMAEALRRGESIGDLARAGLYGTEGFSAVCTPSRRSGLDMARVRATDSDLRVEPPEEALPPMPTTVVALARRAHVPQMSRPRHPSSPATAPDPEPAQPVDAANSAGHHARARG